MQIKKTIRRTIATVILTAGLAYPACAAVCPKGRGGCPDPGRCFLYVDADKNALCDYTAPAGSQGSGALPSSPAPAAQVTATPAPAAVSGNSTTVGNTVSGGFLDSLHISPLTAGVVIFLILSGILFLLLRSGILGGLVNVATGVSAPVPAILVICAVVLFALVAGRTFCGNICPVGSLQELAYNVPSKKLVIHKKGILELVRLAVFVITVIAAVYLIDLMAMTGLYDFFSVTLSAGFVVAAGLVVLSVFLYRPVCRILCPFGVLFSLFAEFSWFRLPAHGSLYPLP
jgi:hypothetical protein